MKPTKLWRRAKRRATEIAVGRLGGYRAGARCEWSVKKAGFDECTTVFGVLALSFMMAMYSLEGRHRRFTLAFAFGCLLSSGYGFVIGAWPFGVVEINWCVVALRKVQALLDQPKPS